MKTNLTFLVKQNFNNREQQMKGMNEPLQKVVRYCVSWRSKGWIVDNIK